ncbi:MAG: hypothetical protein KM312_10680 [Hydrogenibacillus schlegelii]|uniref:Transcription factor NikR nickel binding C-terminal domain-containing protein n=1 Tax=Hydrogenibacillus schlegelii TaxID=1484 RepID=A0A947CXS0_HYDSH|nr:hypothetical protein [Hydrogenibacillus schlegelii]
MNSTASFSEPLPLNRLCQDEERMTNIIATMHIHLNHALCMEVIAVRGKISHLRDLHQRIQVLKGVFYAELSVTYFEERGTGDGKPPDPSS